MEGQVQYLALGLILIVQVGITTRSFMKKISVLKRLTLYLVFDFFSFRKMDFKLIKSNRCYYRNNS